MEQREDITIAFRTDYGNNVEVECLITLNLMRFNANRVNITNDQLMERGIYDYTNKFNYQKRVTENDTIGKFNVLSGILDANAKLETLKRD